MDITSLLIAVMVLAGLATGVHVWRQSGKDDSWLARIEAERSAPRMDPQPRR